MNGGDLTRSTFRPHKHYSGVRMQQGRVQLDADWNEQLDVTAHRQRAGTVDVVGEVGVPKAGGGFELAVSPDGRDLLLSPGRAWVGGHLCEVDAEETAVFDKPSSMSATVASLVLDGRELGAQQWVEVLSATASVVARVTAVDVAQSTLTLDRSIGSLAGRLRLRRRWSYAYQPDLPAPDLTTQAGDTEPRILAAPDGAYLGYLDVWERSVTALDDPEISEPALGVDTTTRTKVVWQLRLLDLAGLPEPVDCDTDLSEPLEALAPSSGRMAARAEPPAGSADLCRPTPAGGYVGLENQLYRVHVHDLDGDRPVVLWSRENASVATAWRGNVAADRLDVAGIGRDPVLGFQPGDWVELLDDTCILESRPGTVVRLLNAQGDQLVLDPPTATGSTLVADFPVNPKVRRWDSPGNVTAATDDWIELEDGVQVRFPLGGRYRRHDYWLVPARSATAGVDWPQDSGGEPLLLLPAGVRHFTGRVGIVTSAGAALTVTDCRDRFPSLTELTAADVAVENDVCRLPGVETVQDAIDALCRANDLRRHNRLLHGYGIVCGLAVHCGDETSEEVETDVRRHVTVQAGSAIDADGNDLDVPEPVVVDVLAELESLGEDVLDGDGDGEVALVLRTDPDRGPVVATTPFQPRPDSSVLEGTLLLDIYEDCIANLQRWIRAQLVPAKGASGESGQRAYQLRTALTNLATYVANPKSGGQVFVSAGEDTLLRRFYEGLRKRLRSQTFCAMFDDARPFPDYPESLRGIRTVSGVGWHSRVRLHPGGTEAWTTGSGINPVRPATMLNRYDLEREQLVARIDPVSGKVLEAGEQPSSTAAAVTDVAFSPDGRLVYVAVPTRDDNDTLFRVGEITADSVRWRPASTICGVKLVTLATTAADPGHVYAVGLRRREGGTSRFKLREFEGAGIWRIPAGEVPDDLGPMPGTELLDPVGHLVVTPDGTGVFTCGDGGGGPATSYSRLGTFSARDQSVGEPIPLDASGRDDLTLMGVAEGGVAGTVAFTVVGQGRERALVGYDVARRVPVMEPVTVADATGTISLQAVSDRVVLVESDRSAARVFDMARQELVEGMEIPVQVAPASVAAVVDKTRHVVVLNVWSNSLTVVDRDVVMGDPLDLSVLLRYRREAVEAFADLVGGFAQYLKDCICDHLLVRCPPRPENTDLDLAAVSIRGGSVYKVCNFSRRRYIASFPTVGYWLSLVPIVPALGEVVRRVCCAVLPDYFARYSTAGHDSADDRVAAAQVMRLLEMVQTQDPLSRLRGARSALSSSTRSAASSAASGNWSEAVDILARPAAVQGVSVRPVPEAQPEVADLLRRVESLETELASLRRTRGPEPRE